MHPAQRTLYGAAYTLAMSAKALYAAEWQQAEGRLGEIMVDWARTLCERSGVTVRAEGLERVEWQLPMVVGANHQSLFDIPALLCAVGRPFGFLSKQELRRLPLFGRAMQRGGCVFVDRSDPARSRDSIRRAAEQVRGGASIVVFPEGTRGPGDRLLPFKKGPFYLVQAARVPLVPVGILGTNRVLRRDGLLTHPGEVIVRVGAPLQCRDDSAAARSELRVQLRRAIRDLTGLPYDEDEHA